LRAGLELALFKNAGFTAKNIGNRPINSGERIYDYV
jgi:hypothetical protein